MLDNSYDTIADGLTYVLDKALNDGDIARAQDYRNALADIDPSEAHELVMVCEYASAKAHGRKAFPPSVRRCDGALSLARAIHAGTT